MAWTARHTSNEIYHTSQECKFFPEKYREITEAEKEEMRECRSYACSGKQEHPGSADHSYYEAAKNFELES